MPTVPADLTPLIAATAQWLVRAYPAAGGTFAAVSAELQARQAVTVAAWLRYPDAMAAGLVALVGPGGSARLDWLVGSHPPAGEPADGQAGAAEHAAEPADPAGHGWRSWVDEVVASWAACLLTDPVLAVSAVTAVLGAEHAGGLPCEFRRLTAPAPRDRRAAPLLRHPDLLAPVADLHREPLRQRLDGHPVTA